MKKANEMYGFCKKNGLGKGFSDSSGVKHFGIIAKNLMSGEDVKLPFIGIHNYNSPTKHDNNFAYAITDKRIMLAQKKVIGEVFQSIYLENINDITYKKGLILGVLTIDTKKEKFNIALDCTQADKLNKLVHDLIFQLKDQNHGTASNDYGQLEDLKRLLDKGIISQSDFNNKKKQILGL